MITQLVKAKSRGTLADKIYDNLKKEIVELELEPGRILLEEELSKELGVSRTPVHSALERLSHEGLVTMMKGKGSRVTPLTKHQLDDLFAVRSALEGVSVKLCARNATEEDLNKIQYLIDWQEEACLQRHKNVAEFLQGDTEFHVLIARIAGNDYLLRQLKQMMELTRRYIVAYTKEERMDSVVVEHKELFQKIKEKDEEAAMKLAISHLDSVVSFIAADIAD